MEQANPGERVIGINDAEENRNSRVPLYRAALKGNWKDAKKIIAEEPSILVASIAQGSYTALHVAAGAGHVHFVEKLVDRMEIVDLRLPDGRGNTAFCVAAAAGHVKIAQIMMRKDPELPKQLGSEGKTPLCHAASFGRQEMSSLLYSRQEYMSSQENLPRLFFTCIYSGLYGKFQRLSISLTWIFSFKWYLLSSNPTPISLSNTLYRSSLS